MTPPSVVDRVAEAVEVDRDVVVDLQSVQLAERAHEGLVAALLVIAGEQADATGGGVERVDLVRVLAAEGAVGRPVARERDAAHVARQGDERDLAGPRVDRDDDHRVGQVAVLRDALAAAVGTDEQDVQARLAVPSGPGGWGRASGLARVRSGARVFGRERRLRRERGVRDLDAEGREVRGSRAARCRRRCCR